MENEAGGFMSTFPKERERAAVEQKHGQRVLTCSEFAREMFAQPIVTTRFQDGRDMIPGVWRIGADGQDERFDSSPAALSDSSVLIGHAMAQLSQSNFSRHAVSAGDGPSVCANCLSATRRASRCARE